MVCHFTFLGKSELLVRRKLTQIYDMQKMREKTMKWSPFYSHLLQSRAALLQDTTPHSLPQRTPILQPSFCMAPSQVSPHTTAAVKSEDSTLKPTAHPQPTAAFSPVVAPPLQTTSKPVQPGAPAQLRLSNSQTECQPQVPSDAASTTSPSPSTTNTSAHPPHPFALPLIRSKTGRIILPSSLRPSKLRHTAPLRFDLIKLLPLIFIFIIFIHVYIFFSFSQLVRASIR